MLEEEGMLRAGESRARSNIESVLSDADEGDEGDKGDEKKSKEKEVSIKKKGSPILSLQGDV